MTQYEYACLLIKLLNEHKINCWIVSGGVDIEINPHQLKTVKDTIKGMSNCHSSDYVDIKVSVKNKKPNSGFKKVYHL